MKTFRGDFILLLNKLKSHENFAFARFSDGEEFILQNKKLEITDTRVTAGEQVFNKGYSKEDHKLFDPFQHQWFRERLIDAFKFEKHNYYKGICCKCCVGEQRNKWFLDNIDDHSNLTWANLFVNGNYPAFIDMYVPEFKNHDIILTCNHKADLTNMPFKIEKDIRVGDNCMINNYDIIEDLKKYIDTGIENKVFLFSASALSKVAIHQLFEYNDKNTYIDIGTTLNYYMKMSLDRDYLLSKWKYNGNYGMGNRICIW
jgi:hypothetical protein